MSLSRRVPCDESSARLLRPTATHALYLAETVGARLYAVEVRLLCENHVGEVVAELKKLLVREP